MSKTNNPKYKVGQRVQMNEDYGSASKGATGKIVAIATCGCHDYAVEFDEPFAGGHSCGGKCDSKRGHWVEERHVSLVSTGTKYKPGDMVTVRDDLNRWGVYHMADGKNPMGVTEQMLSKCGKVVKIKSVTKTGKYMIEGSIFPWVDEMFEPDVVKPEKVEKREPKVGDRVRITKNYCAAKEGMVGTIPDIVGDSIGVKFDAKFIGGHDCSGRCEYGYGQFVYAKNFGIIGEAKPHLICSVKFTENGKLYCYLTDDTTITVGSEVKVPVGKTDREKTATVERIGYYTEADAPYTVSEMKKVIGKATATFDWEAFKKTKIIVKLDTKEKYDAFMKECDEHGIKWRGGENATKSYKWNNYGKLFSVTYNFGGMSGMGYADVDFHARELPDAVVYDYKMPEPKYYNGKVVCVEVGHDFAYTVGKVYEATDGQITIDNGSYVPWMGATSVDDLNTKLAGIAKFVEFKG